LLQQSIKIKRAPCIAAAAGNMTEDVGCYGAQHKHNAILIATEDVAQMLVLGGGCWVLHNSTRPTTLD
jgi:hypothetical protein